MTKKESDEFDERMRNEKARRETVYFGENGKTENKKSFLDKKPFLCHTLSRC
jgi:hypothetical protein